jgi:hypothetical protein
MNPRSKRRQLHAALETELRALRELRSTRGAKHGRTLPREYVDRDRSRPRIRDEARSLARFAVLSPLHSALLRQLRAASDSVRSPLLRCGSLRRARAHFAALSGASAQRSPAAASRPAHALRSPHRRCRAPLPRGSFARRGGALPSSNDVRNCRCSSGEALALQVPSIDAILAWRVALNERERRATHAAIEPLEKRAQIHRRHLQSKCTQLGRSQFSRSFAQ